MKKIALILTAAAMAGALRAAPAHSMTFMCRHISSNESGRVTIVADSPWRAHMRMYRYLLKRGWAREPRTVTGISCRLHRI